MSWLSKAVKKAHKFVANVDPLAKNLPEFQQSQKAWEAGNWTDPYGEEASAWDFLGAGPGAQITSGGKPILGQLDPEDPEDRAKGRAIGTAVADYWTFGLFSTLVQPGAPQMNDVNNPSLSSFRAPGMIDTSTQTFAPEISSVTPSQAALAERYRELRRWTWYGVAAVAVLFILKKGVFK